MGVMRVLCYECREESPSCDQMPYIEALLGHQQRVPSQRTPSAVRQSSSPFRSMSFPCDGARPLAEGRVPNLLLAGARCGGACWADVFPVGTIAQRKKCLFHPNDKEKREEEERDSIENTYHVFFWVGTLVGPPRCGLH